MQSKSRIHAVPFLHQDQFDRIPDSLVLLILNKVADARSLGRCSAVSKRFNSLVPFVHDVYVKIDRFITVYDYPSDKPFSLLLPKPRKFFSRLNLMFLTLLKPFHNPRSRGSRSKPPGSESKPLLPQLPHYSLARVLKNFAHIQNLHVELPADDVRTEDGVFLKWRAEFGSRLQNCVILGGTRIDRKANAINHDLSSSAEDNESMPDSFYTNGGLRLRVVWTIRSLNAASNMHHLFRPIIKDLPTTLRSLVLTDAEERGTLSMSVEQLKEFREKALAFSASANGHRVPASIMKVRYAPYLELPEGMGMQGATLVDVRPSGEGSGVDGNNGSCSRMETEAFLSGGLDEPFRAAVKALVKRRRTYILEINGF